MAHDASRRDLGVGTACQRSTARGGLGLGPRASRGPGPSSHDVVEEGGPGPQIPLRCLAGTRCPPTTGSRGVRARRRQDPGRRAPEPCSQWRVYPAQPAALARRAVRAGSARPKKALRPPHVRRPAPGRQRQVLPWTFCALWRFRALTGRARTTAKYWCPGSTTTVLWH
jgi:hypothetical protein